MNTLPKFIACAVALISVCVIGRTFAGAQRVIVNNTAANPVPVTAQNALPVTVQNAVATTAADNPAFHAFARSSQHADVTGGNDNIDFDVPAGKILVIELMTLQINLPEGQEPSRVEVEVKTNGSLVEHKLSVALQRSTGASVYEATHPLRLYADPGTGSIQFAFSRSNNSDTFTWWASIAGYLVDAPAP